VRRPLAGRGVPRVGGRPDRPVAVTAGARPVADPRRGHRLGGSLRWRGPVEHADGAAHHVAGRGRGRGRHRVEHDRDATDDGDDRDIVDDIHVVDDSGDHRIGRDEQLEHADIDREHVDEHHDDHDDAASDDDGV